MIKEACITASSLMFLDLFILFHVHKCFSCVFICVPHTCLVPTVVRRRLHCEFELQTAIIYHVVVTESMSIVRATNALNCKTIYSVSTSGFLCGFWESEPDFSDFLASVFTYQATFIALSLLINWNS